MAQKPEWAARRNVGGAWFAHKEGERTNAELRFSKKCYEGKDEFQRWDYLKNPNDLTPWQVERGGSKWTKKGVMPQRRKKVSGLTNEWGWSLCQSHMEEFVVFGETHDMSM